MDDNVPVPQYERLRRALLEGIEAGRWAVGGLLPTESELTDAFAVSRITVRRALQELRSAGVVETARGRRTRVIRSVPQRAASLDGVGDIRVVTLSVPWLASENILAMMRGAEEILRPAGWTAVVTCTDNDPEREERQARQARRIGVAGLIVYPAQGWANREVFRELSGPGLPLVYLGRYHPEVEADRVVVDNAGGAAAAVQHLLARGHRRIAFVNGEEREVSAVADRLRGYCAAHERAGIPVDFSLVLMDVFARDVPQSVSSERIGRLWDGDPPTAALVVNTPTAVTFRHHLRALGRRCELAAFSVSTDGAPLDGCALVEVPAEAMGREAATLMLRRLQDDWAAWPRARVLPVHLRVAGSETARAVPPLPAAAGGGSAWRVPGDG